MKRHLTSVALVLFLAAVMVLGYFVSPIFIDLLIVLFAMGAAYEMRKSLKAAGYQIFSVPIIVACVTSYPVFYLMQTYLGDGRSTSAGLQGLLIVLLACSMLTLTVFTFRPAAKEGFTAIKADVDNSENNAENNAKNGENNAENICQNDDEITSENGDFDAKNALENASNGSKNNASAAPQKGLLTARKDLPQCGLKDLFANIFLLVYPTAFFASAWVISYKYGAFFSILYAIIVPIIGSDTFAYLFGSLIKGKKLCPEISPKKTVAGAVGGIFGGMALSMVFWVVFEYVGSLSPEFLEGCGHIAFFAGHEGALWKSALIYLAIGFLCGLISELGDLAASRIKRAIGIKDYGKIFPGHGGILDRVDSVLYCLVILLVTFSCVYGY